MNPTSAITRGTWVCVNLGAACHGTGRSLERHRPAEDGMRGLVTGDAQPGSHSVFVLFKGRAPGRSGVAGFLPLGRCCRPDELEVFAPPS